MPTISKFYGIQISLRTGETNHPRAHFHARYAEHKASIAVDTLEVLAGSLPPRALEFTLFWAAPAPHRAACRMGNIARGTNTG
jgi:Domain of unknown function (DUF4160)